MNEDYKEKHNDVREQKNSDHLYLEKLEFNPELKKNWLNFFIVNFRVVILMIILLTGIGLYSFFVLPRESNPEVKIPIALVMTAYPGASPADVEELVTKKIETGISGIKNIKKINSKSMNSVSAITVEFDAKANLDDSIRKLRDQVTTVQKNLPTDANEPFVKEISLDDTPIWTASLTGPYDGLTMRKFAEDIQDELEKIPGVREVLLSGGDETEIEVAYDPEKLIQYNISADSANQLIKASNLAIPAGSFDGQQFIYPIRVDSKSYTAEDIAKIPLLHSDDGAIVILKDIASVKEKAIKKTVYSRLSTDGQKPNDSITIEIVKKTGSSIIDTVNTADKKVAEMLKTMPQGMKYSVITDQGKTINDDFNRLTHDFILTIILVGLILFLIVGFKEALVAGLAVPLVFFATFGIMLSTGISLNFLSIFSLILALGLLVDDAIVVVSATKQYLKTGKFTPEEAVLLVLNDFKVVLTTTTLTTVWAFLPLLMSTGIMGEYIKSIPITVSVTLLSSLFIALMINHPLAAVLERIRLTRNLFRAYLVGIITIAGSIIYFVGNPFVKIVTGLISLVLVSLLIKWYLASGKRTLIANEKLSEAEWCDDELIKEKLKKQSSHENDNLWTKLMHGIIHFDVLLPIYEKYLKKILATKKTRLTTISVTLGLFILAIALPITGVIPSEFFPASNLDYVYINVEAPTGLKLSETDKIINQLENKLLKYKEIKNFTTIVGAQSGSGFSSGSSNSTHLSTIIVNLVDKKDRRIKSYDLAETFRKDFTDITQATVTVEAPRGGPPSGSPFEARIYGDDLQQLDKVARDLKPTLTTIKGVTDVKISLKPSPADYTFTLDKNRLELYNLNAASVGATLRMAIAGLETSTILRDGKEVKIIARFDESKLSNLESIQNLQILNNKKQPVFIKDVAKIELKPSVDTITRIDQKRVVLLSAGINGKTRPQAVVDEFEKKIKKDYKLPDGYYIKYGGENEQNTESVMSIIRAMSIAGILIITTLIIQFNSFKKAMIVLVTIPLALIGVFFGMAAAGINLSFPGLIGILALFGIVVKNAIILVDKINLNIKFGIPFKEAVIDAGKSRLEAIFITSICTILGIIPITLSDETWQALGSAVIFGLMLSSFFTLFIVPTLYMTLIKENER